jgi:hypothetical protein
MFFLFFMGFSTAGVDQDTGNVSKNASGSSIFQTKIWNSPALIFENIWGINGNYWT